MLKSMTGFGVAIAETKEKKFTVEIKSLNHKFIETTIKLPQIFSDKELEIKNECIKNLKRGKIYITINIEDINTDSISHINTEVIAKYYKTLLQLTKELNVKTNNLFESILSLPEVTKVTTANLDTKKADWEHLKTAIKNALEEVNKYRIHEGLSLYRDIVTRINKIKDAVRVIAELEIKQKNDIKERIYKKVSELSLELDNTRMDQEILFYIERCSISEELTRLEHHCKFFNDNLTTDESKGKKLSFIIQEILRELNTINAKSIDPEIQKLSINAKEEVDNIKEQLFNVL